MTALTVVGFASGSPFSQMAMTALAREQHLAAIVVPDPRGGLRQRLRRILGRTRNALESLGVPLLSTRQAERVRPDLFVVASFQRIIPAATLASARLGALNVHMSLLPAHRGPDPLFWTYWNDDSNAGVTVHWMDARPDAGDIVAQEAVPLERGLASRELYMRLAALGVDLLGRVLVDVAAGNAARHPQDESRATYESGAQIARARVPFAQWPAERVWHVLSGLGDQRSGLLADTGDRKLAHGRATRFRITGEVEPGRVTSGDAGYEVHCCDGIVEVARSGESPGARPS